MRIAHVHGHGGLSTHLLLGACLDAGASLAAIEAGWQSLGMPAAQVSMARVFLRQGAATRIEFSPARTAGFLHQQSTAVVLGRIDDSALADRTKRRLSFLLTRLCRRRRTRVRRRSGRPR